MSEASTKPARGWWPSIETELEAKRAAYQGAGAAVLLAGVTTLRSILAIFDIQGLPGSSPLSLIDAGLFAIVAWRIYRMSRAWALAGLLLYVYELTYSVYLHGTKATASWFGGAILLVGFVNGARGTFAYHGKLGLGRNLAIFGVFDPGRSRPSRKFHGDYLTRDGEYVTIMRRSRPSDWDNTDKICASIRLAPGQSVKEIQ